MKVTATRAGAYNLLHEGMQTLSRMEGNGIRIDTKYLERVYGEVGEMVREIQTSLRSDSMYADWRKRYGEKTNFDSDDQLANLLFKVHGFQITKWTDSSYNANGDLLPEHLRKPSVSEEALASIDHPFVRQMTRMRRLSKTRNTFLNGIRKEVVDGFLHAHFNLHLVKTYRSSSDLPNFQNFPKRNKEIRDLIRPSFIPRDGRYLVEFDYSGIEVRIGHCYHEDPTMFKYLTDADTDMHRDMAAQIYQIQLDQVSEAARHTGKNMFVFPEFYGSFYVDCARDMWNECHALDIRLRDPKTGKDTEVCVIDWLKTRGITRLGDCDPNERPVPGTFEHHVKKVEEDFWGRRFKVYNDWRKRWYRQYQDCGYFDMFTGFRVSGQYAKNQVINSPVQGVAFHCLLRSLTLIDKELRRRRMCSLLVGQIHDSGLGDVPEGELQDFIHLVREIMTETLASEWKWINVPLQIGVEVAEPGGSWNSMAKYKLSDNGLWVPKSVA